MPFSDLWHASPVGQKKTTDFFFFSFASGSSDSVKTSSPGVDPMCYNLLVMLENVCCSHLSTSHYRETSPMFALEDTCTMSPKKRWALNVITAALVCYSESEYEPKATAALLSYTKWLLYMHFTRSCFLNSGHRMPLRRGSLIRTISRRFKWSAGNRRRQQTLSSAGLIVSTISSTS